MAKLGFYQTRRTDKGGENSTARWERDVLRHDSQDVIAVTAPAKEHGLVARGGQLLLGGKVIAISADPHASLDGEHGRFGEIPVKAGRECVNVTLDDYNRLRQGEVITGYRKYDPQAIYNIVEDVASAEETTYEGNIEGEDRILGSIEGLPVLHEEDPVKTYTLTDPPHVSVFDPMQRLLPGGKISLRYMVDTHRMDGINHGTFGETFTVRIRDMYGRLLLEKTTYAGIFSCEIGPMLDEEGTGNLEGEGWWEIQAVDSRGVGSVVQFFDFLAEQEDARQMYDVTAADLAEFGIVTGEVSAEQGWRNKRGLTRLMASKSPAYKGIRLYNPGGDTEYWVDYHQNIAANPENDVDLGQTTYSLVRVYHSGGVRMTESQPIVQGGSVTKGEETIAVDTAPLEWIKKDRAKLYRDSKDKVKVCWPVNMIDTATETAADKSVALRCYTTSAITDGTQADGYYYAIDRTVPKDNSQGQGGDNIAFPDRFTLDLNGATVRAIDMVDLGKGVILEMNDNYDTHIVNGKVEGLFGRFDWQGAYLTRAIVPKSPGSTAEHVYNIGMVMCRYCSFENVESIGALSYDSRDTFFEGRVGSNTNYSATEANKTEVMDTLGFIGPDGGIDTEHCLIGPCDTEEGADSICLVHQGTYRTGAKYSTLVIRPSNKSCWEVGKKHEIFVAFYTEEGGVRTHIRTVKSRLYYNIKRPHGANRFRVCGYGLGIHDASTGELRIATKDVTLGGVHYTAGRAWELWGYSYRTDYGRNNLVKGCYIHDTRSCALTDPQSKGFTYDSCRWKGIALWGHKDTAWRITSMLGDIEEGWHTYDGLTIKNCVAETYSDLGDIPGKYYAWMTGCVVIQINTLRNLLFENNIGFSYRNAGGIESALVINNQFKQLRIRRNHYNNQPCEVIRHNRVSDLGSSNNSWDLAPFYMHDDLDTVINSKNTSSVYYNMRKNRCDDPIDGEVTLVDVIMPAYDDTNGITLRLERSKVGKLVQD